MIPIINENDTVTTDEISVGDNDTLGALVANLIEADVLVLLTDQSGLYNADPRKDAKATLVREARAGDPALEAMAGGAGSALGKGGMLTKVLAAKRAARSGASTVIASGVLHLPQPGEVSGDQRLEATGDAAERGHHLGALLPLPGQLAAHGLQQGAQRAGGGPLDPGQGLVRRDPAAQLLDEGG